MQPSLPGYGPPPGYPPPPYGYGPPPGYPPPYGYGIPPPERFGPPTREYTHGERIPPGYHLEQHGKKKLIVAGVAIFGGCYLASALAAGHTLSERYSDESTALSALFIPVAGPFVTIGTTGLDFSSEDDRVPILFLMIDGLAQTAGVVLAIAGLSASETAVLVRNDQEGASIAPQIVVGARAAALRWQF